MSPAFRGFLWHTRRPTRPYYKHASLTYVNTTSSRLPTRDQQLLQRDHTAFLGRVSQPK